MELDHMNALAVEPSRINLRWENLSVIINKSSNRYALDHVSGYVRAGRILALMGPSSSGKTTLINLLTGRPLGRQLIYDPDEARIYLNDQKITDSQILIDQCGYVEQPNEFDALIQSITVREHLLFQAMLRLPTKLSDAERYDRIGFLIKRLRLTSCANTLIKRLSGGEARRVALAACLLTNPSILLIDDLSSGLDSHLLLSLMRHIRSLQKTTIVVLHQPTVRVMRYVDDVCLLGANAQMLYSGPYQQALSVFHFKCPVDINPADFFLEQAANARPTNPVVRSLDCKRILQQQTDAMAKYRDDNGEILRKSEIFSHSGFFRQVYWLLWRSYSFRDVRRLASLLAQSLCIAIIYGLLDFGIQRKLLDQRTVQNVGGLVFRILTVITRICSLLVITASPIDHILLEKESKQQGLYSIAAYYTSKFLADSCMFIVMVVLFTLIVFVCTGLRNVIRQCLVFILATLCSAALGCLVSASIRSKETRLILWMPISQIISNVSGFYVNTKSIPYILKWAQYSSLYYYSYSLSLICQWRDVNHIACPANLSNVTAPQCNNNGGDVLYSYNVENHSEAFYWLMLLALTVALHIISYIVIVIKLRK